MARLINYDACEAIVTREHKCPRERETANERQYSRSDNKDLKRNGRAERGEVEGEAEGEAEGEGEGRRRRRATETEE